MLTNDNPAVDWQQQTADCEARIESLSMVCPAMVSDDIGRR
jgi:hypothetical protein